MFKKIAISLLLAFGFAVAAHAQGTVSQEFQNNQTGTTYTVAPRDCSKLVTLSNASAVAVTLPQAGTSGNFFAGCFIDFLNKGNSLVTITPTTSTVDGRSTFVLSRNEGIRVTTDGTNYFTQSMHTANAALGTGSTGSSAGSALLTFGNTGPSVTNVTPSAWIRFTLTDGNVYVIPAWR